MKIRRREDGAGNTERELNHTAAIRSSRLTEKAIIRSENNPRIDILCISSHENNQSGPNHLGVLTSVTLRGHRYWKQLDGYFCSHRQDIAHGPSQEDKVYLQQLTYLMSRFERILHLRTFHPDTSITFRFSTIDPSTSGLSHGSSTRLVDVLGFEIYTRAL